MLFSSVVFLFAFLPVTLALYYIFWFSRKMQNIILLVLSLFFYAWGEPKFVLIMLLSIIVNYVFAMFADVRRRKIKSISAIYYDSSEVDGYRQKFYIKKEKRKVRWLMILVCAFNLGLLFVFKYLGFAANVLNETLGQRLTVPQIMLPIGISFFTFQAMSYVIDVYRGDGVVQKNPLYVGLYIAFFPQLIAGPIVRYQTVADQILNRKETWRKFSIGSCRFITGLGKKVLVSNNMAIVADHIYTMSAQGYIPASLAWLGSIAYTLQIFFDFSGYSDMAIGLGLMFGFKFDENFNYPYISTSVTEFWRRWHISLGSWFKSYVYFPLGGSKVKNKDTMVRNMLVVWFLTGVWHGANWTFIFWGLLNFAFLITERFFEFDKSTTHKWARHLYLLLAVNFGWVFFRAPDLRGAWIFLCSMFGVGGSFLSDYTLMFLSEYWVFFIAGIIFSIPVARRVNYFVTERESLSWVVNIMYPVVIGFLFFVSVTYLITGTYNPFIYFNF